MINSIDQSFSLYLQKCKENNFHEKNKILYEGFSKNIDEVPNVIIYGLSGTGKYTQALLIIEKYSEYSLNYIKKISIETSKKDYYIRISDIHYEVDFQFLGHSSKTLWSEIYNNICDIILASSRKFGFIICKNFHNINTELMEVFYSYIQNPIFRSINVKYILLTENIAFIQSNIVLSCLIINTTSKNIEKSKSNIPELKERLCNNIIQIITKKTDIDFIKMRNAIYDLFIYNLDFHECIWFIISKLIKENYIKKDKLTEVNIEIYKFLKLYNNNYRFISHCEKFFYFLIITCST